MHRAIAIVGLMLALGMSGALPVEADGPAAEPKAPAQIDQTPPLVPIPNARVSDKGLLVGGQPTADQLKAIQQAGYRLVVSLRTESERGDEGERAAVERLGMKFVSIPVAGPAGLTEANARALSRALGEEDVLPAVVHCSVGERAAALLGLEAFVVGRVSPAAAIDIAKLLGMRKLEQALRDRIHDICKRDVSRNCGG
jgi:protein tyrosine phosphatase (PTP) superfamily phosphohydrolase (DUF442 family)